MLNLGIPIEFSPVAGGGGGSKWYAPRTGAPATLPIASGANSLSAGNASAATNTNDISLGFTVTVSGGYSVGVGTVVISSGSESVTIGSGSSTTSTRGVNIGPGNGNSGIQSFVVGNQCAVSGFSSGAMGSGAVVGTNYSLSFNDSIVTNNYEFTMLGSHGRMKVISKGAVTANATPLTTGEWTLKNNSCWMFHGEIAAIRASDGASAGWKIEGLVKNIGGTYTIIGSIIGVAGAPNYNDAALAALTVAFGLSGGGKPELVVTGLAATNIYWHARIAASHIET